MQNPSLRHHVEQTTLALNKDIWHSTVVQYLCPSGETLMHGDKPASASLSIFPRAHPHYRMYSCVTSDDDSPDS